MKNLLKTIFVIFVSFCVFSLVACSSGGGGGGGTPSASGESGTSESGTSSGGDTVVKIPDGFVKIAVNGTNLFVSKYETKQGEYKAVIGKNPSTEPIDGEESKDYGVGDNYPVYNVSWYNAIDYCIKRSNNEKLTPYYEHTVDDNGIHNVSRNYSANGYRLPTSDEWTYLAKANQNFKYAGSNTADEVAWHKNNSNGKTHEVGTKKANGFDLYDMSGNVVEWCDTNDGWRSYVIRGGYWAITDVSVSWKNGANVDSTNQYIGFRVVRKAE